MTNIFDNLHIGAAKTNVGPVTSGGFGFGPVGRFYVYDIVPLTLSATNIAASQTPGASTLTLTAGTGITKGKDPSGNTIYILDVPRAITITSGGVDTGITFTVKGYDVYGSLMTQTITGGSGSAVTTLKAFKSILSITPSAAVATTASAGTSDVFGLPVCVVDAGYITNVKWNETLAADAGTFVPAVTTIPSTALLGDVRGTYKPSANASNGTRRLVVSIALSDLNIGGDTEDAPLGQTVAGVLGQPQV